MNHCYVLTPRAYCLGYLQSWTTRKNDEELYLPRIPRFIRLYEQILL